MRLSMILPITLLATSLVTPIAANAQSAGEGQRIQSPAHQVALLELYTSEGCSSCPPADKWLGGLKDDKRLWKTVVPVAFHVDYWDYIGWPDRFASKVYSTRHRDYARYAGLRSVYTPGFLVQGEEWRGWFRYPTLELNKPAKVGVITVDIDADGKSVKASYSAASKKDLELHIAVLGFDLQTEVKAGENDGRVLHHDFVVLGYQRLAMTNAGEQHTASSSLPKLSADAPRMALAAWVSRKGNPTPVQAAGDWLKN